MTIVYVYVDVTDEQLPNLLNVLEDMADRSEVVGYGETDEPRPGEEIGAGGACAEHGVYEGRRCPGCVARDQRSAVKPLEEPEA